MKSLRTGVGGGDTGHRDIATLRVILVTFTKYLLCSKFLSFSLHCWIFVTNYRIRHHLMYCMDKKGSKIQTLFFKNIEHVCVETNLIPKSTLQLGSPLAFRGFSPDSQSFLSLPFSLDSFSVPWSLQYLRHRVNNLSCNLTLKDLWLFYVNDEK